MIRPAFAAIATAALFAGCAAAPRTQLLEIVDGPIGTAPPLAKVSVVAIARDPAVRRAWEEAFAARFAASGLAVAPGDGSPGRAATDADAASADGGAVVEAARRAGAQAIFFVQPPSAVPIVPGRGAYRWMDARSAPDFRGTLDDANASVAEVRLFDLRPGSSTWHAYVLVYDAPRSGVDPRAAADAVAGGLARRGYLRAGAR